MNRLVYLEVCGTLWGTYGKGGIEHCNGACPEHPLRIVRLIDRESSHLKAILNTQYHIRGTRIETVIREILKQRGEKL